MTNTKTEGEVIKNEHSNIKTYCESTFNYLGHESLGSYLLDSCLFVVCVFLAAAIMPWLFCILGKYVYNTKPSGGCTRMSK